MKRARPRPSRLGVHCRGQGQHCQTLLVRVPGCKQQKSIQDSEEKGNECIGGVGGRGGLGRGLRRAGHRDSLVGTVPLQGLVSGDLVSLGSLGYCLWGEGMRGGGEPLVSMAGSMQAKLTKGRLTEREKPHKIYSYGSSQKK